jgi:lycopene cyclase domain-containing protein
MPEAYGLLMLGALMSTIGLGLWWRDAWWKQPSVWLATGAIGGLFAVLDIWAVSRGWWSFNPQFVMPWKGLGLPAEEWAFFAIIPLICLVIWRHLQRPGDQPLPLWLAWIPALTVIVGFIWTRPYSQTAAALVAAGTLLVHLSRHHLGHRAWWRYQLILLACFIVFDTILTTLTVVHYNPLAVSGLRTGTIPLEDWLYNYAFVSLVVVAYERILNRPSTASRT